MFSITQQQISNVMKPAFLLFFFTSFFTFSQNCSCEDNFNWLKKTFEENDAGFIYTLEQKGEDLYASHNKKFRAKIKPIKTIKECSSILNDWLRFFRSGHIGVRINNQQNKVQNGSSDAETLDQFKDWEKYDIGEKEFEHYISKLKNITYEGVWESKPYKIGVIKTKNEYIGFVLEADGVYWKKNQIKFRIRVSENDQKEAVYYMKDHSPRIFKDVKLVGKNYLQMGFIALKRLKPYFEVDKTIEEHFALIKARNPMIKELNDNTILLRIPSFSYSNKKYIDSLIMVNHNQLIRKKNLIIDVRNNGGGSDASYKKIIPYLYTNPIRTVGVKLLSTPLNNNRMKKFMKDPNWSAEEKKWAKEGLEKLNKHIGEFVNLDDTIIDVKKIDTIHPYPKNVAIVINKNNGSTTEQFLLAAKQSKKVKLYGTTTTGVLDISNMNFVDSPCKDLQLGYSLSKSMRIPEMTIDNKGIQPDYYIDKSIPDYQWIKYVEKILKED